ncbi:MAG: phosphopantothenoylcysteine decarboxylase domain-containing protein [Phycisphaerales bacterium]
MGRSISSRTEHPGGVAAGGGRGDAVRLLITAGPTHEPIDAVRYLGNRSSGTLGVALADAAAGRGWETTLLLGPSPRHPSDARVVVRRFQTTADLEALLGAEMPGHDALIMAAAVADYRPKRTGAAGTKLRRGEGGMTLELESTPDLLAGCTAHRRAGQVFVGFALEPAERLVESARSKLVRKGVDLIVANPLETMDSPSISATLLARGSEDRAEPAPAGMDKQAFAGFLLDRVSALVSAARAEVGGSGR